MYTDLLQLEHDDRGIRVIIAGAGGSMGRGVCLQTRLCPGLRLIAATDTTRERAQAGADLGRGVTGGRIAVTDDTMSAIRHLNFDVLVESTNSVESAARYCIAALKREKVVVLMNSEVDLLLGPLLSHIAERDGGLITSDQGDQYGALSAMADEVQTWGLDLVMLGNIKGFLNRYATVEGMLREAGKRRLAIDSCVAQTDGTKLNIEMALLCNAFNLKPTVTGMIGPRVSHIHDIFELFDFDAFSNQGVVDYILGAQPGGGVFVIGRCDDPTQQFYLNYYKLHGRPPYYLFYRPYHLCHLETPRAIAKAYLYGKKVMEPSFGKVAEVFAHAKRDLKAGMPIERGIGCDEFYGMVDLTAGSQGVPVALLEGEGERPTLVRALGKDDLLTWDHVEFPGGHYLLGLYDEQRRM